MLYQEGGEEAEEQKEEKEPSDSEELQWFYEEKKEKLRFKKCAEKLREQIQKEQEIDSQKIKNDIQEEFFDNDEPDPNITDEELKAMRFDYINQ